MLKMMMLISFESNAVLKRALTNQSLDSSQHPFLESILGAERYQLLLKEDPSPLVLEMRSIATAENGPLNFAPKYDIEIARNDWRRFEPAWNGVAYTDRHSPTKEGMPSPTTIGRVLKSELRTDGWYTYVYVLPDHSGYKSAVKAEAILFPDKMVRSVSTEFSLDMKNGVVQEIRPALIAEVPRPNIDGSGVTGVFNQSKESAMEKQEVINALKVDDLKGSNVLVILEKEHREETRKLLVNDVDFRKEVLAKLTDEEKKALVNGLSKELVAVCDKMLEQARVVLNELAEGQKAKDLKFRKDVQDMFKTITQNELADDKAGYLIVANSWKPGQETEVKKYIEFHNQLQVSGASYFEYVIENQKKATTGVDNPVKDKDRKVPEKEPSGFAAVANGFLSILPGKKKKD